jgi:hypothetical protein
MTSSESVRFVKSCRAVESYWCQPRCILCPTLQIGPAKGGKRWKKDTKKDHKRTEREREKGQGTTTEPKYRHDLTWLGYCDTRAVASVLMPKEAKAQAVFVSSYGAVWVAVQSKHQRSQARQHGTSILWTKLRDTVNHMSCKQTTCWNLRLTIENVAHSSG